MNVSLPSAIRFGREVCGNLAEAERREWWLANGLGGYASGTIAGTLTRRYHGLLIAPINPPLGRHLVFAKADATLIDSGRETPLFANRWASGSVDPQGHLNIESFYLDGRMPVWRYALADVAIEQRIWMEPGANTTYIAYRLVSAPSARRLALKLTLLINARDHHGTAQPWQFNPIIECDGPSLTVQHPNWFSCVIKARGGSIVSRHAWYENFVLSVERERGLADRDSHLCVGEATLELDTTEWVGLVVSLEHNASVYLSEAMRRFHAHELGHLKRAKIQVPELVDAPSWIDQLVLASDSFVFARPLQGLPDGESVIAGYPWFGDWGRDTMIALPGLALATGRFDTARRILLTFAQFVDQGMLPNVFPGAGDKPDYNTADAALWYIEACRAYFETTRDRVSLKQVFPVLHSIVDWHVKGTRYGIAVDSVDGLLRAGEHGVQITWMDAKVGDWVVTPRIGKPVEINALWYNALVAMLELARAMGEDGAQYAMLAGKAKQGFARFVNTATGGLFDVLDGPSDDDATIRPNQIFAVSLPATALDRDRQAQVVELCARELLTSYGLRTLNPNHPDYRPQYRGGVWERDGAYHQGPVWAWLLGHFALAEFRVRGDLALALTRLEPMRDHLCDAGLGTISEIFDAATPHTPRGAPVQAWSVACILESWWRLEKMKTKLAQATANQQALAVV